MDRDLEHTIGRIANHVYYLMETSDRLAAEAAARDPHEVAPALAGTLHLACRHVHSELRDLEKKVQKEPPSMRAREKRSS